MCLPKSDLKSQPKDLTELFWNLEKWAQKEGGGGAFSNDDDDGHVYSALSFVPDTVLSG